MRPVAFLLGAVFALALSAIGLFAQPRDIQAIFNDQGGALAALSKDGKYVAYSEQQPDKLVVHVLDIDANTKITIPIGKADGLLTRLVWKGERIIFSDGRAIWSMFRDGSKAKQIYMFNEANYGMLTETALPPPPHRTFVHGPDRSASEPDRFGNGGSGLGDDFERRSIVPGGAENLDNQDSRWRVAGDASDFFAPGLVKEGNVRIPVVADMLVGDEKHILVEVRGVGGLLADAFRIDAADFQASLVKVNVVTGDHELVESQRGSARLKADGQGRARLSLDALGDSRTYTYSAGKAGWRNLAKKFDGFTHTEITPAKLLEERTIPMAFDFDGKIMFFASNVGRNTYGIYSLDTSTGKRTDFVIEHPQFDLADFADVFSDQSLLFDLHRKTLIGLRFFGTQQLETIWFDPELAGIQASLGKSLSGRVVQLQEWDAQRERLLVLVTAQNSPGEFFLVNRKTFKMFSLAKKAPVLAPDKANPSVPYLFNGPAGTPLSGFITLPREPRLVPPPLLVYLHDGPWSRDLPGFNRGAQALATMGFAVLQVNYRGSIGFGREHLNAIKAGLDRVPLEDVFAAIAWAGRSYPINIKQCAILGDGFGGYLALRAAQLHPEAVRCVVALNAPTNLVRWFSEAPEVGNKPPSFRVESRNAFWKLSHEQLNELSPLNTVASLRCPVLLVHNAVNRDVPAEHSRLLAAKLKDQGTPVEYLEISSLGDWRTEKFARVFSALERFFNEHIYNYSVKTPEPKVISTGADATPSP